jgi:hypothetical protein
MTLLSLVATGLLDEPSASLQENVRYGAAVVAWLVIGGGAWFTTRAALSKKPEEKALRGKVGRAAFLSGGMLGAVLAFMLSGSGPGLGGGGTGAGLGDQRGKAASFAGSLPASSPAPASLPAPTSAPRPAPVILPKTEVVLLIDNRAQAGRVRYLLDEREISPPLLQNELDALRAKHPELRALKLLFTPEAPAADVVAAQKLLSAIPGVSFTLAPLLQNATSAPSAPPAPNTEPSRVP